MSAVAFAAVMAGTSTAASAASAEWLDRVIAGNDVLPALILVQEAAVDALGVLDSEQARGWATRARWRGAVPSVHVTAGSDADLGVRDSYAAYATRTTSEERGFGYEVGARWDLGDLVFSSMEMRASREALARSAAIQLARERVTKIYFERVKVLAEERTAPSLELSIAGARLDGLLRAMAGGGIVSDASKGRR